MRKQSGRTRFCNVCACTWQHPPFEFSVGSVDPTVQDVYHRAGTARLAGIILTVKGQLSLIKAVYVAYNRQHAASAIFSLHHVRLVALVCVVSNSIVYTNDAVEFNTHVVAIESKSCHIG